MTSVSALCASASSRDLKGKVTDPSGTPVESALVVLMSGTDSTVMDFTYADTSGFFSLDGISDRAFVEVSFIGFEKVLRPVTEDFLTIVLEPSVERLDEVTVTASRGLVDRRPGRLVYSPPAEVAAAVNAYTILGYAPLVTVNRENVSVVGGKSAEIWIDGRRPVMGQEAAVEKLKLLYDILRRQILSSEYVQVDESVIPVIDNEKHKARKGYEWCVRDGITGDVMFWYDRGSRGHHVAREILGGYRGNVQCDGYEAYDQFERMPGITVHGCWSHVRRKFVDSLKENERLAMEGILFIRKLYKVESDADDKGLSAEERMEQRRKISYPTILMFEKWIEETYARVLPKSRLGEALAYAYSLLPRLSRYVNDGRINIDNNLIENAIRPLALGRKNYLFCGNDASAYRAAIVYSLIGTCRAAGVDPRTWMEDVLSKLPYWQRDGKDLAGLLPRAWAKENQITPK